MTESRGGRRGLFPVPRSAQSSSGIITVTTGSPSSPGPQSALSDQRRGPLLVVVADVDGEAHLGGAAALPADGEAEQRQHVPQPARLVLAQHAGRQLDALPPRG